MATRTTHQPAARGLRCPTCHGLVRSPDAATRDPNADDPSAPNHPNMAPKNVQGSQGKSTAPTRGPIDLSKLPPGVAQAIEALLGALTTEETQEQQQGEPPPGQTQGAPPPPAQPAPGTQPGSKPVDNSGNPPQNVPDDIKKAREDLGLPVT